jgi:hypothetical protein
MAIEKNWLAIPVQLFSANGTADGKIQVPDSTNFKVKQKVLLYTNSILPSQFEVKRVNSDIELEVGRTEFPITDRADLTTYTVASGAAILANLQPRNTINNVDSTRAVYEEEPTVALRNVLVDKIGEKIDSVKDNSGINRLAVDGQFHAAVDVQVDVEIEGVYDVTSNPNPDNIGVIGNERSISTTQVQQTQRITAIRGSNDTDTVSQDISLHDGDGNKYTNTNRLPITTSFDKFFEIIGNSKWMDLASYDQVVPVFSLDGKTMTLTYKEDSAILGEAIVYFNTDQDWNIILNRFIDEDDGSILLDDDGTSLNLD